MRIAFSANCMCIFNIDTLGNISLMQKRMNKRKTNEKEINKVHRLVENALHRFWMLGLFVCHNNRTQRTTHADVTFSNIVHYYFESIFELYAFLDSFVFSLCIGVREANLEITTVLVDEMLFAHQSNCMSIALWMCLCIHTYVKCISLSTALYVIHSII